MRGKWILLAGVAILVAVIAGALSAVWRDRAERARQAQEQAEAKKAGPPASEISLSGTVQAQNVVPVPASVNGTLEIYYVEEGQEVFEGQLLARIRNTRLETERDAATAELERIQTRVNNLESGIISARLEASRAMADANRARADFERVEKVYQRQRMLYSEGATPRLVWEKAQKDYERTKAEYEGLQELARQAESRLSSSIGDLDQARVMLSERTAEFEHAQAELQSAEVHSPVDGIVVAVRGQAGDVVDPGIPDLLRIATELNSLQVTVMPDVASLPYIHPGQPAVVQLPEAANEALPGQVLEVRDGTVVVVFQSPTPAVKPGLTAQVRLKLT
ncbi:MAG TPA: efflux RND transporter periplasmic adaptor subunit [Bryobacteraceae bacterium]|nr:efflux RND transporter periplasmic adaptor subunit [Bryobacteraceae bacterium]